MLSGPWKKVHVGFADMRFVTVLVVSFLTVACGNDASTQVVGARTVQDRLGTRFLPATSFDAPRVSQISVPVTANTDAIWGATGRDDAGRVYFGASTHGGNTRTAYLYQYHPDTGALYSQGNVLTELHRAGFDQDGQGQNKLHSKIYQANDGYLYFASFDEDGETDDITPLWGGHLWRKKPDDVHWEHLLATKEALIAVNTAGRFIYALGYWGHVLYRYDTADGSTRRVEVGSVAGHISRNLIVDLRGHVYVPSVTRDTDGQLSASLGEYDSDFNLVYSHRMDAYLKKKMSANEGIVSYATLKDGRIVFLVGDGDLYLLTSNEQGESALFYRGKIHPKGDSAIKSLFALDGGSLIVGIGRELKRGSPWEWVIHEVDTGVSASKPLQLDVDGRATLYGSVTRDNSGAFYAAGFLRVSNRKQSLPLLLRFR